MTRRTHAIAMFLVMLLVGVACAASFAQAADVATDLCEPSKGWGPAKVESSASAEPPLFVPAIPAASADVSEPASQWAGLEDAAPVSSPVVLVQLRAPRAPPLA